MMHGFSAVDGFFFNVKEGVDEMIEFLANEPSVGLFFVQQHAQTSMPYLLNIKDNVGEKIREVTLHTEDIEDSIFAVRSMTEHGITIADEMIMDINRSLLITSTSQPKRGFISNPRWGFQVGGTSSSTQNTFSSKIGSNDLGGESSRSYLSSVFNSAKQKAAGLRWPQPDLPKGPKSDQLVSSSIASSLSFGRLALPESEGDELPVIPSFNTPTPPYDEGDELPVSSQLFDQLDGGGTETETLYSHDTASVMEDFDKFKSEREAKLEEWLQETGSYGVHRGRH